MKKIHLVCNAHLDPVWLWQWKEGAAEAVSTFRIAADFCEKYDGFVFNHNEAVLYEWIEEYEPELFERIKKLVKNGKWKIMGGWYLQPDCTMLSGESFLSQIELGRKYFKKKFGAIPTTAVNFDPFGHTRGLVQILEKTGYNSYIFMRPQKYERNFIWEGFADTSVIGHCIFGGYNTLKGEAAKKLLDCLDKCGDEEASLLTWGIGNHGGGPSEKDLNDINKIIEEEGNAEIIHSTPDDYFKELKKDSLSHISTSLVHTMVGCYSAMANVKKHNRLLENRIAVAQKMAVGANLMCDCTYPEQEINDIKKTLAFCQFHDILPGTCIKGGEEDAVRDMSYALKKCDNIIAKSFFELARGQKEAADGEIPIMIYNPHPYEIKDIFKVGFMLQNQNWNEDEITIASVYDENGNPVLCQDEKAEATFNLDWVKSTAFYGILKPCSMNRFNVRLKVIKKLQSEKKYGEKISLSSKNAKLVIDRRSGLIEEYSIDGKLKIANSGVLEVYRDNEDPWGMTVSGFCDKEGEFKLLSDEETGAFLGYCHSAENVVISEDGDVRTKIDIFFGYKNSYAVTEYIFNKISGELDIKVTLYSANANKCVKYRIDTGIGGGRFYGQTAFGVEELISDGSEAVFQKWCGIKNENDALYVINNSAYGGSFNASSIYLTLLRTPVYSAHPIAERQIAPHNRFLQHIDMGERSFEFKITSDSDYEKKALVFNETPVAISYFPHGDGKTDNLPYIMLDNEDIILSLIKKEDKKIVIHLFNSSDKPQNVKISGAVFDEAEFVFKGYELKFFEVINQKLVEIEKIFVN